MICRIWILFSPKNILYMLNQCDSIGFKLDTIYLESVFCKDWNTLCNR